MIAGLQAINLGIKKKNKKITMHLDSEMLDVTFTSNILQGKKNALTYIYCIPETNDFQNILMCAGGETEIA